MTTREALTFCILCAMALFVGLGVVDCQMKEKARTKPAPPRALHVEEKAKFNAIAKKHGLLYDVNVVYDWPGHNAYFIDKKGRRCSFK